MCELFFCGLFFSIAIEQPVDVLQLTTVKGDRWNNESVSLTRLVHRTNELPDQQRCPFAQRLKFCSHGYTRMQPMRHYMRRQSTISAISFHAVRHATSGHVSPPPPTPTPFLAVPVTRQSVKILLEQAPSSKSLSQLWGHILEEERTLHRRFEARSRRTLLSICRRRWREMCGGTHPYLLTTSFCTVILDLGG